MTKNSSEISWWKRKSSQKHLDMSVLEENDSNCEIVIKLEKID